MNESTKSPAELEAEERFWVWLRSKVSLSTRLVEALGDLSQFSVLRYIESEHTNDGGVLKSFAIKIVPHDVAEAEIARRKPPHSPFADDYEFGRGLPAGGGLPIEVNLRW